MVTVIRLLRRQRGDRRSAGLAGVTGRGDPRAGRDRRRASRRTAQRTQSPRPRHRLRGGLPRQDPDEGIGASCRASGPGLRSRDAARRNRRLHGDPFGTGRGQTARRFWFHRRLRPRFAERRQPSRRHRHQRPISKSKNSSTAYFTMSTRSASLGVPIAAIASHYTGQGCLEHWTDAPFGSRTLDPTDPVCDDWWTRPGGSSMHSPHRTPSVCTRNSSSPAAATSFFAKWPPAIGGGPIPTDAPPRSGHRSPASLGAAGMRAADRPGRGPGPGGGPPRTQRSTACRRDGAGCCDSGTAFRRVHDFTLNTHVGDEWIPARYNERKSADFLAYWVMTDTDLAVAGRTADRPLGRSAPDSIGTDERSGRRA